MNTLLQIALRVLALVVKPKPGPDLPKIVPPGKPKLVK